MEEVYDGFVTPEEMEDCGVQEHKTLEQMIQESVVTAVDSAMKNVLKRFDLSPKAPKQKAKKAIDTLIAE